MVAFYLGTCNPGVFYILSYNTSLHSDEEPAMFSLQLPSLAPSHLFSVWGLQERGGEPLIKTKDIFPVTEDTSQRLTD